MKRNGMFGVIAGAGLLGLTVQAADAVVVIHDNSDQTFFWKLSIRDVDGTPYPGTFLDITKAASEQTGEQRQGTIGKWYFPNNASDEAARRQLIGESGFQTAKTTDSVVIPWKDQWFNVRPTRDYAPGESVSASDNWSVDSPGRATAETIRPARHRRRQAARHLRLRVLRQEPAPAGL
jgi:hypothetical protein